MLPSSMAFLFLLHAQHARAAFFWQSHQEVGWTANLLAAKSTNQPVYLDAPTSNSKSGFKILDDLDKALQVIEDLEALSSPCKRAAGTDLLNFCASFDSVKSMVAEDTGLDRAKELYALRTTACTRSDALQAPFSSCTALSRRYVDNETFQRNIQACKDEMYRDNSAWVSFELARQGSVMMCHAVRAEAEKEQQVSFLKKLIETVYGVQAFMDQHEANFQTALRKFGDLQDAVANLRLQLHRENQELLAVFKRSANVLKEDFATMATEIDILRQTTDKTHQTWADYQEEIREAIQQTKTYSAQMGNQYETGLVQLQDSLEIAQNKYRYSLEQLLATTYQQVYAVTNDMEQASAVARSLGDNLDNIDIGIITAAQKLRGLDVQLDVTAQKQHGINRNFDELQARANATREHMEQISEQTEPLLDFITSAHGLYGWAAQQIRQIRKTCIDILAYWILVFCLLPRLVPLWGRISISSVASVNLAMALPFGYLFKLSGLPSLSFQLSMPSSVDLPSLVLGSLLGGVLVGACMRFRHRARPYDALALPLAYAIPEDGDDSRKADLEFPPRKSASTGEQRQGVLAWPAVSR